MKDHLIKLASQQPAGNTRLNVMREYLQSFALRALFDAHVFRTTAFVGGTALRFLYDLPRYSEDLDFSLIKPDLQFDFIRLLEKLKKEFALAGYEITVAFNDRKVVHTAHLRFPGLLFETGLSPVPEQNLTIRIEIDTRPPTGANLQSHLVTRHFPMAFLSYDRSSLLAGKTHALLTRSYTKGRDYFDLGWYLSRWPDLTPNFNFLENSLRQTHWPGPWPDESSWKAILRKVVERVDWQKVRQEMEPLLEDPGYLEMFTQENILGLLKFRGKTE